MWLQLMKTVKIVKPVKLPNALEVVNQISKELLTPPRPIFGETLTLTGALASGIQGLT